MIAAIDEAPGSVDEKPCSRCKRLLPLTGFNRHKRSRDGHRPDCRSCQSRSSAAWNAKPENKQRVAAYLAKPGNKERRAARNAKPANKKRAAAQRAAWYAANKQRAAVTRAAYYAKSVNKHHRAAYQATWHAKNKDYCAARQVAYHAIPANKQRAAATRHAWYRATYYGSPTRRARHFAEDRRRKMIKRSARPKWLNEAALNVIYHQRDQLIAATGIKHEVDHLYPIRHHEFCGMDVPWNLRVITATENASKNNKRPDEFYSERDFKRIIRELNVQPR